MLEGGRVVAVFCLVFLLTETGVQIIGQMTGWCGPTDTTDKLPNNKQDGVPAEGDEVLKTITVHCLPKLVCQLFALTSREQLTTSETNLINLIGSVSMSTPSKYSYAAHMGQLVRGVTGQGCHNFYPSCPFSNNDVMEIARRINFK